MKGHRAAKHPVLDLFALACCPLILATPASSFSHYAAHALGPASTTILPPARTTREAPGFGYIDLEGQRLEDWTIASRQRKGFVPVTDSADLRPPAPARTDWLG